MNRQLGIWHKSTNMAILLSTLSIICIGIFSFQYYIEKQLSFTYENILSFILVGGMFLLVCIFAIYFSILIKHILSKLILQQEKLDSVFNIVQDYKPNFNSINLDLANVEDNLLDSIRETQNLILKLEREIGAVKCNEIETPIAAKNGSLGTH